MLDFWAMLFSAYWEKKKKARVFLTAVGSFSAVSNSLLVLSSSSWSWFSFTKRFFSGLQKVWWVKTTFIKKPVSSKNQFHQKTTFIRNHFHHKSHWRGSGQNTLGCHNIIRISVKVSVGDAESRRRFHRNTAYARFFGFQQAFMWAEGWRCSTWRSVEHEGLLKVKKRGC